MTWVENLSRREKKTQAQSFHLPFGKWMWRGNSRKPHSSPLDFSPVINPEPCKGEAGILRYSHLLCQTAGRAGQCRRFVNRVIEFHHVVKGVPSCCLQPSSLHSLPPSPPPPTKRPIFSPLIMIAPQQRITVHTQWDLRRYHSELFIGLMKIEKNPKTGTNSNVIVS